MPFIDRAMRRDGQLSADAESIPHTGEGGRQLTVGALYDIACPAPGAARKRLFLLQCA